MRMLIEDRRQKIEYRVSFTLVFCFLFFNNIFSQQNSQLNREWSLGQDSTLNFNFKPYIHTSTHQVKDTSKSLLVRKLWKESLLLVNDTAHKFYLTIDPLFNFEGGVDLADTAGEKLYKNTRGFLVRGDINKKFAFESSFYETQSNFVQYIDDYIAGTGSVNFGTAIVPGQGRPKVFNTNGYDYAMASGYISYTPSKIINVQLGHGKHFIGDGYRSLLLSDNAFNYPYARITTTYKNFQYTNLYTSFMNMSDGGVKTPLNIERIFQKKVGSFQMLSANLFKRLTLGVFQGMIWEASDSTNRQHVNFNTFDPVIGVNSVVYGLHNKNNILLGATFKFKIIHSISVYGQYMLDDIASGDIKSEVRKKYGYQIGFKYFDVFRIKNLHVQAEYNSVRPYAYATDAPAQSYTHFGQALAHPLGANFNEMVGFINYRFRRFFVELKVNYAVKGVDSSASNFGGNIFRSDNNFSAFPNSANVITTQGFKTTTLYQDFHVGLLVNPATNFNVFLGVSNRIFVTDKTTNTRFIYFGIRTSLSNFYYDF